MKRCTKCGVEKPLDLFFRRSTAADGRMSSCKECKTRATYEWRDKNRQKWNDYVSQEYARSERKKLKKERLEAAREAKLKYFDKNKEAILRERARRQEGREAVQAYRKKFRSTGEYKERANLRRREKHRNDPAFRLNRRMSAGIYRSLVIKKGGKTWQSMVPYTFSELVRHIERQFLPGMCWDNMGKWHIDHIVPLASFCFDGPDDPNFKAAWAITNLRPLWAKENLEKHSKIVAML